MCLKFIKPVTCLERPVRQVFERFPIQISAIEIGMRGFLEQKNKLGFEGQDLWQRNLKIVPGEVASHSPRKSENCNKDQKEVLPVSAETKNQEIAFYESCRKYASRKGYEKDVCEDFPSWAFVKRAEGHKGRLDQLFIDYLRFTFGCSGSEGHTLRKEVRLASSNCVEYEAATSEVSPENALLTQAFWVEVPERDREILRLFYVEGLTKKEVGAVLGVSEARISQRMTRALAELKEILARWR